MTDPKEKKAHHSMPSLTPRAGANLSSLYEEMAQDPDVVDDDLVVRAQLTRYGEQVRAARKRRGLTQNQLSNAAGITQARISKIESGTMDEGPTFRTMARLERILGVEAMSLGGSQTEPLLVDPAVFSLSEDEQSEILAEAIQKRERASAVCDEPGDLKKPIGVRVVKVQGGNLRERFEVVPIENISGSFPHGCIPISGFVQEIAMPAGLTSTINRTKNYVVLKRDPADKHFAVSVVP